MNLFIRNLHDGHFDVTDVFDLNATEQDLIEDEAVEPFNITVSGNMLGTEYYLNVEFNGKLKLDCDRCLEVYHQSIADRFDLTISKNQDLDFDEQQENVILIDVDAHEVDISEVLINEIQLAIPMKHLHDKNCKGLCSQCGENLNKKNCNCKQISDPRLDELKKIKF